MALLNEFNSLNSNTIALPPAEATRLLRLRYFDTFGPLQRYFKTFGFMPLNSRGRFITQQFKFKPFMWSRYQPCGTDTRRVATLESREWVPCDIESAFIMCTDFVNSCFSHYTKFRNGSINDDQMMDILDEMMEELLPVSIKSLRVLQFMGMFHTWAFGGAGLKSPDLTTDDLRQINTYIDICPGLLYTLSQTKPTCDAFRDETQVTDENGEECGWGGDAAKVLDRLMCCGQEETGELLSAINQGFINVAGQNAQFPVSDTFMPAVRRAFDSQTALSTQHFKMREVSAGGETANIYFYKGIPIVPISDINAMDPYLLTPAGNKFRTLFASLTVSRALQLGSSFGPMEDPEIGYKMQRSDDIFEKGQVKVLSMGLIANAVVDKSLVVWDYAILEAE
jgi:hypothetical protein